MTVSEQDVAAKRPEQIPNTELQHSELGVGIERLSAFPENDNGLSLDSVWRTNLASAGNAVTPDDGIAISVEAKYPVHNPAPVKDEKHNIAGPVCLAGFKFHKIPLPYYYRQHTASFHRDRDALSLREHFGYPGEHLGIAYYQLFHKKGGPNAIKPA